MPTRISACVGDHPVSLLGSLLTAKLLYLLVCFLKIYHNYFLVCAQLLIGGKVQSGYSSGSWTPLFSNIHPALPVSLPVCTCEGVTQVRACIVFRLWHIRKRLARQEQLGELSKELDDSDILKSLRIVLVKGNFVPVKQVRFLVAS